MATCKLCDKEPARPGSLLCYGCTEEVAETYKVHDKFGGKATESKSTPHFGYRSGTSMRRK